MPSATSVTYRLTSGAIAGAAFVSAVILFKVGVTATKNAGF